MKIGFTGVFPYLLSYDSNMVVSGKAMAFYVQINDSLKDNKGVHEHEFCHVRQWWQTSIIMMALTAIADHQLGFIGLFKDQINYVNLINALSLCLSTFQLLYYFIENFRFNAESQAFACKVKEDSKSGIDKIVLYASCLATGYRLNKTQQECIDNIKAYL